MLCNVKVCKWTQRLQKEAAGERRRRSILGIDLWKRTREDDLGKTGSGFERCLIHQHDGNVVFHRIDPMALSALQALGILPIFERLFAGGADKNLKQIFSDHRRHCTTEALYE